MPRRILLLLGLAVALAAAFSGSRLGTPALSGRSLASRLTDREFWQLSVDSSEPSGYFRSENLTSNEMLYQTVIPDLLGRTKPGDVYLGVGPEQNFTYIAAIKPSLAVIFDIRRGNLLLQLMYKSLFELARDRAEFVSMLFAKPKPAATASTANADALFRMFGAVPASQALYAETSAAIAKHLTAVHHLPLSADDLKGIELIYQTFYRSGFAVRYSPTYAELMTATDQEGVQRSYLASEANFAIMKDLESRNLVVPVVGDFGGPKAIRAIGRYLKERDATVSTFYLSNVEQYLYQDGKRIIFCRNVATLPLTSSSTFIRSASGNGFGGGFNFISSLGEMAAEVSDCR